MTFGVIRVIQLAWKDTGPALNLNQGYSTCLAQYPSLCVVFPDDKQACSLLNVTYSQSEIEVRETWEGNSRYRRQDNYHGALERRGFVFLC